MSRQARGAAAHRAGLAAEDAAARRYAGGGAEIVARRWRRREGEIDLVVRQGDALVFVEVKSGRHARESIDGRRLARLEAAASRYIAEDATVYSAYRFDAAFVDATGAVDVVENVVWSGW
jgi:putative endonuclease